MKGCLAADRLHELKKPMHHSINKTKGCSLHSASFPLRRLYINIPCQFSASDSTTFAV